MGFLKRPYEQTERKICSVVCNATHHVKAFLSDLDITDYMWDMMGTIPDEWELLRTVPFIFHPGR